jgi:hypothetical protein
MQFHLKSYIYISISWTTVDVSWNAFGINGKNIDREKNIYEQYEKAVVR